MSFEFNLCISHIVVCICSEFITVFSKHTKEKSLIWWVLTTTLFLVTNILVKPDRQHLRIN